MATATLKLPVPTHQRRTAGYSAREAIVARIAFSSGTACGRDAAKRYRLIAEKRRWIETEPPANRLRERHQRHSPM